MVTESKKAKRARWKEGLRRKRDSIFRSVFLSSKQGLVIMTLHIIVTIQLYHEGDKNKNLKPPKKYFN